MSAKGPKDGFALIIDTNSYAGNFEREMTAYLTGQVGECEVGEEMVEELPISFENVMQVPDDNGCHRPTSCWLEKKSGKNNAVAIFFETRPTQEQIDFIKERVKTFDHAHKTMGRMAEFHKNDPPIEILGFRLEKFENKSTEEVI